MYHNELIIINIINITLTVKKKKVITLKKKTLVSTEDTPLTATLCNCTLFLSNYRDS